MSVPSDAAGGNISGWVNIATGAKGDVLIRVVAEGSNNTPAIGYTHVQVR